VDNTAMVDICRAVHRIAASARGAVVRNGLRVITDTTRILLVLTPSLRQSHGVEPRRLSRPNKTQVRLFLASAVCYALGYPIALAADQPWGWLLVTLGGVFLLWLGVVTIRRVDGSV
jgi:hypothetical protein